MVGERGRKREEEGERKKFLRRERTAGEGRALHRTGKERAQIGRKPGGQKGRCNTRSNHVRYVWRRNGRFLGG